MPRRTPAGFEAVHPMVLVRVGRWDMDLFLPGAQDGQPVLLRGAGVPVDGQHLDALIAALEGPVLVRSADFHDLAARLMHEIDAIAADDRVAAEDRFVLLQTAAGAELELASSLIDPRRFVEVSRRMGGVFVRLLQSGELAPAAVFAVARHDPQTFTHVTNVCCYALTLAAALGVSDAAELQELALGALLHDAGKRHIPVGVLRKTGALTKDEWSAVRAHPQRGFEDLAASGRLTLPQLLMIYQHHERVDGGGYPVGLTGAELHPWSRLLAVADVFDALTGRRHYRRAWDAHAAVRHLRANSGTHFDTGMVECWASLMERQ